MFEKNPPGQIVLRIHQKNDRLRMELVPSPKFGMPEELASLGNPPDKPKAREVEFSKKEDLREEVEIY